MTTTALPPSADKPSTWRASLAFNVREAMDERQVTLAELANSTGLPLADVHAIANGLTPDLPDDVTVGEVCTLAAALHVWPHDLVREVCPPWCIRHERLVFEADKAHMTADQARAIAAALVEAADWLERVTA